MNNATTRVIIAATAALVYDLLSKPNSTTLQPVLSATTVKPIVSNESTYRLIIAGSASLVGNLTESFNGSIQPAINKTPVANVIATTVKPLLTTTRPKTTTMDQTVAVGREHMLYASMFTFSTITILLLVYMSIFGRRVRLSGWLFHTVNFSAWNAVQLVNFAGTSLGTPLPDFVDDRGFTGRMKEIQAGTLAMFAAGMIFVFPYNLLCYAFPNAVKSHFCSWIAWIPIIVGINFSAVYLFCMKDLKNIFQSSPIDAHLFFVNLLYNLLFLCYIVGTVVAVLVYNCKLVMFVVGKMTKNPSDIPIIQLTFDLINLILVIPYAGILWFLCLFPNVLNFVSYAMSIIHININILLEFAKYMPAFVMDWAMTLMKYQEYLQLFLPCSQFILTCALIPYYREQAIFLLSCGYFYSKTKANLMLPRKAQKFLTRNQQLTEPDALSIKEGPERTPVTNITNN